MCGVQDKEREQHVADVNINKNNTATAKAGVASWEGSEKPAAKFVATDRAAVALNFVCEHTPFTPPLDDQDGESQVADKFGRAEVAAEGQV